MLMFSILDQLPPIFTEFIPQMPLYLVWLIGILVALLKWRSHPRLSLLVLITLICFAVLSVLEGYILLLGPSLASENHWDAAQLHGFLIGIIFIFYLLSAVLWGLIFWAIFGKALRSSQQ